jgi:raffinose/stachyose/melibiose transport system substrate-binding protein
VLTKKRRKIFMKKRKWLVALVIALAMLVVACGGNGANDVTTDDTNGGGGADEVEVSDVSGTLSILSWHTETVMQPLLDMFNETHPNVEFDFIFAAPVADYIEQFRLMSATDTLPDIFITAVENRVEVMDNELAIDLSFLPVVDRMSEANIDAYSRDGVLYALSVDAWFAGVMYNLDILEENGIAVPTNRVEYLASMETLRRNGVTPWTLNVGNIHDPIQGFVATETIENNREFDAMVNDGELTFVDGWSRPIELWVSDYLEAGNINDDVLGLTGDQTLEIFAFEEAAYMIGATWTISQLEDLNPDLNYGIMPWFGTEDGVEWLTGAAGVGWSVNSQAENMDAAVAFIEFLASDEALLLFQQLTGGLLTVSGLEFQKHPAIEAVFPIMLSGNFYLPAVEWRHSDAIGRELMVGIEQAILGEIPPEQIAINLDNRHQELDEELLD